MAFMAFLLMCSFFNRDTREHALGGAVLVGGLSVLGRVFAGYRLATQGVPHHDHIALELFQFSASLTGLLFVVARVYESHALPMQDITTLLIFSAGVWLGCVPCSLSLMSTPMILQTLLACLTALTPLHFMIFKETHAINQTDFRSLVSLVLLLGIDSLLYSTWRLCELLHCNCLSAGFVQWVRVLILAGGVCCLAFFSAPACLTATAIAVLRASDWNLGRAS